MLVFKTDLKRLAAEVKTPTDPYRVICLMNGLSNSVRT